MESQTLLSALLAILLVASVFQAMQISRMTDGLEQMRVSALSGRSLSAAPAAFAAVAPASAAAPAPPPASSSPLGGYATQVGGC